MKLPKTIHTASGPTVEGASAELLGELLAEFEATVRSSGGPTEFLRPGIPRSELERLFAANSLELPEELAVWFGWHDGEVWPDLRAPQLFGPASPHLVVDECFSMRAAEERLGDDDWDWNPEWLRITGEWSNGLAVRCRASDRSPLVRHVMDEIRTQPSQTTTQLVSLCTPVAWWIEAIRAGHYQWQDTAWKVDVASLPSDRVRMGWA